MAGVEGEGVGKKQAREQGERDGRSTAFPTPLYSLSHPFYSLPRRLICQVN